MLPPSPNKPKLSKSQQGGLAAVVGVLAASLLYSSIPRDEGRVYVGYLDLAGIPTKCSGDTSGVLVGWRYSEAECRDSLDRQLIAHAAPVMHCTPGLAGPSHDYQRAAAVSLAYNIGTAAYCRSTVALRFNAGNYRGACDAFLAWNRAKGRVIAGLVARRQRERELCLKGLP